MKNENENEICLMKIKMAKRLLRADIGAFDLGVIEDINSSDNFYGIKTDNSLICSNSILRDSIFVNNHFGIFGGGTFSCSFYSTIYNNTFGNLIDLMFFADVSLNLSGVGNVWLNLSNGGFSQICDDLNFDSVCDESFTAVNYSGHVAVDYFPQVSSYSFPVPLISIVSQTPSISQVISDEFIYISVVADSLISSCRLNWNGTYLNSMYESGNSCYINKSGSFNNTYSYFVEVNGINFAQNFTSVQNVTMIDSVFISSPVSGSVSLSSLPGFGFWSSVAVMVAVFVGLVF